MLKFLHIPFPRPKNSRENLIWIFGLGLLATLFVIVFNPFGIISLKTPWYYYLILFSIGFLFSGSIVFMELLIPKLFKKPFKTWNLGKAILWYAWLIIFVGGIVFLYKSFLAGFSDFNWSEYIRVIGRLSAIALIVSFFSIGIFGYFKRGNIALLSSNEEYLISTSDIPALRLNLDEVLYIESDDNYVDIHIDKSNKRDKIVLRSSLKNIEEQIVNPLTPMYRCHRSYIININHFNIKSRKSRNTSLELKKYKDEIPVSNKYAGIILELLQIRP